jgi:hypothetical protein
MVWIQNDPVLNTITRAGSEADRDTSMSADALVWVPLRFTADGRDVLPLTSEWRSSWTIELPGSL